MQLTYEQQTQRIATLERKLAYVTEKETQLAAQAEELEAKIKLLETSNTALAFDSGDYRILLKRIAELEAAQT